MADVPLNVTYCKLCHVPLTGPAPARQHYESKKHKNKEMESLWRAPSNPPSSANIFGAIGSGKLSHSLPDQSGVDLISLHSDYPSSSLILKAANPSLPPVQIPVLELVRNSSDYTFDGTSGFCRVCNIPLTSQLHAQQHLTGQKHVKAADQFKKMSAAVASHSATGPTLETYRFDPVTECGQCFVCRTNFSGIQEAKQHLQSEQHKTRVTGSSTFSGKASQCLGTTAEMSIPDSDSEYSVVVQSKDQPMENQSIGELHSEIDGALGLLAVTAGDGGRLSHVLAPSDNPRATTIASTPVVTGPGGQVWYMCHVCNKGMNTLIQLSLHNQSPAHLKKAQGASLNGNSLSIPNSPIISRDNTLWHVCMVCRKKLNCRKQLEIHLRSHNLSGDEVTKMAERGSPQWNGPTPDLLFNTDNFQTALSEFATAVDSADENVETVTTGHCTYPGCAYHCNICNVHSNSERSRRLHEESKSHKDKLSAPLSSIPSGIFRFWCEVCKVPMNTTKDKEIHESGQAHQSKVIRCVPAPTRELPDVVTPNLPDDDITVMSLTSTKPRAYQRELYTKAVTIDSVCFLPTGTGKTLVAVMVISRLLELNPRHSVVFLADKVLLTLQQSRVIKKELADKLFNRWSESRQEVEKRSLNIGTLCGQKEELCGNVPLAQHDIIVCTAAFYTNLIDAGTVHWSDNCLVIFDEVHHCNKDHPYNKLIQRTRHSALPPGKRPKVLGLTASPAGRESAAATVTMLRELLANVCAKKLVAVEQNIEELESYQSNADLVLREVSYSTTEATFRQSLLQYLLICLKQLVLISNIADLADLPELTDIGVVASRLDAIAEALDTIQSNSDTDAKVSVGFLSKHVKTLLESLVNLESIGLDAAYKELNILLSGSFIGSFQHAVELKLPCESLIAMVAEHNTTPSEEENQAPATFEQLVKELIEWWDNVPNQESAMALVLVRRRSAASALELLLANRAELVERGIRITRVTGHGKRADGMNVQQQAKIIDTVSQRQYHVIVATSVAEEGVDLPDCDLVVQLDAPDCVRALVQVRGRARRRHSKFVAFCRDSEQRNSFESLQRQEKNMMDAVKQINSAVQPAGQMNCF